MKNHKILNKGIIFLEKSEVCIYSITNTDKVINTINPINGKSLTLNILALYKAIDSLNKRRNTNIVILLIDTSSLYSNALLVGFIYTNGHFSIKLTGEYRMM